MSELTHIGLFSGIGGDALAAQWAGFKTLALCEVDEYCRLILRRNWPDTIIWEDIENVRNREFGAVRRAAGGQPITVISGGYPCQGESLAGKRGGKADDRWLWPEMLRLVRALRPAWVIGENVAGHVTMGLAGVQADLEGAGYESRPFVIPACAVGALHRRNRVFVVAHASCQHLEECLDRAGEAAGGAYGQPAGSGQVLADSEGDRLTRAGSSRSGRDGLENCGQVLADSNSDRQQQPPRDIEEGRDGAGNRRKALADSNGHREEREQSGHRTGSGPEQDGQGGRDSEMVAHAHDGGLLLPSDPVCSGGISPQHGRKAVANTEGIGVEGVRPEGQQEPEIPIEEALSRWDGAGGSAGWRWWQAEPGLGRVVDGISTRVDRYIHKRRLEALGNAIVPQQIYPIFRAIALIEGG